MRELTIINGLTAIVMDAPPASAPAPPILFIHGAFGGAWQFEGFQRHFAALGHSSYALNLRGHCGSRAVPDLGRVSLLEYVDDALAVAGTIGRPIVVGHSMGGLVAQKLAEAGAVSAAVLLCAVAPKGISNQSPLFMVKQLKHAREMFLSRPILPNARDADDLFFNRVPPAERAALFERAVPESGRAAREMSLGMVTVDERRVTCPVLSITAEDDRWIAPRVGQQLARKYQCDHVCLPGHGHALLAEPGWETVAEEVVRWLRLRIASPRVSAVPSR